ncbi:MAG: hypothetical protein B5M51_09885 [Anaerolinea sp. 4484_236]|nr:MAG: hypothetical protein B5M51_09885 [Anaerolinea sp. 4484_236]
MFKKKGFQILLGALIIIGTLLAILYLSAIQSTRCKQRSIDDAIANERFYDVIGHVDDINNEISIDVRTIPTKLFRSPSMYWLGVVNYTDEVITFPNNGFGIVVYSYDEVSGQWKIIEMNVLPSNYPFKLPSHANEFDLDYVWILNRNALVEADLQQPIRIFVSGVGDDSQLRYGAYIDLVMCE